MGLVPVVRKECLRGTLEDMYMETPPRFETHSGRNKLWFLTKTLYDF